MGGYTGFVFKYYYLQGEDRSGETYSLKKHIINATITLVPILIMLTIAELYFKDKTDPITYTLLYYVPAGFYGTFINFSGLIENIGK